MKTNSFPRFGIFVARWGWRAVVAVIVGVICSHSFGQTLRRDWVRTYSNDTTKFNQATAIAMTPDGNIVVAGTSTSASGDMDYQLIKYSSNGDEIWRARYDLADGHVFDDQLRGMTIDPAGNVIVTGTSATVKFAGVDGKKLWEQPLGGRAIVASASYVYLTGFSNTDIATAQLENNNVDGKELWARFVDGPAHGDDIGQAITLDGSGNVYVAGQEEYAICSQGLCHKAFLALSYTPAGAQRWLQQALKSLPATAVEVNSILLDSDTSLYLYGNYYNFDTPVVEKFDQSGSNIWGHLYGGNLATKMIWDSATRKVIGTGRKSTGIGSAAAMLIVYTGTETEIIQPVWTDASSTFGFSGGTDIAQDSLGNLYIAGFSANDASSKAMLLAKVRLSGQQVGLDRYNSPNGGSNVGTALAVDANDDVYVTGYVLNTQGGSEFVTIKYAAAATIENKPSGAMHVEFHTNRNQQYAIEATTDFLNWQSLITNTADASGLVKFDDTNAVTIPYRFYRGKQP